MKVISSKGISKVIKSGGKVNRSGTTQKESHNNAHLHKMSETLDQIIDSNKMHMRQHHEGMSILIKKITDVIAENPSNLEPVEKVLSKMVDLQNRPKSSYRFDIKRDGRDLISTIMVTPE